MAARGSPGPDRDRIGELSRLRGDARQALAACEAGTCGLAGPPPRASPEMEADASARDVWPQRTSCAGLMLPPLQMIATLRPANRPGRPAPRRAAAAPDGSTRFRVFSIMIRVAASSSLVGHQHEVVEQPPHDALRQLERRPGGQALGDGRGRVGDQRPALPGPVAPPGAASDCTPITSIDGPDGLGDRADP